MPRTLNRGDTYPPLTGQVLATTTPTPIGLDLSTASSLTVIFQLSGPSPITATRAATMSAASGQGSGLWIYPFVTSDPTTFIVGNWKVQTQAIWANGGKQTFPNDATFEQFIVVQDLDNA